MLNKVKELELKLENYRNKYNNFKIEGEKLLENSCGKEEMIIEYIKNVYYKKLIELREEKELLKKECDDFITEIEIEFCKNNFNIKIEKDEWIEFVLSDEQYSIFSNSEEGKIISSLTEKINSIPNYIRYSEEINTFLDRVLYF